jgi:hypothetical protein
VIDGLILLFAKNLVSLLIYFSYPVSVSGARTEGKNTIILSNYERKESSLTK